MFLKNAQKTSSNLVILVSAPIESSSMTAMRTEIETMAKSSVATANQEILKELVNVIKRVESDSTFANAVARELGFVFTASMSALYYIILYYIILRVEERGIQGSQ